MIHPRNASRANVGLNSPCFFCSTAPYNVTPPPNSPFRLLYGQPIPAHTHMHKQNTREKKMQRIVTVPKNRCGFTCLEVLPQSVGIEFPYKVRTIKVCQNLHILTFTVSVFLMYKRDLFPKPIYGMQKLKLNISKYRHLHHHHCKCHYLLFEIQFMFTCTL